MMLSPTLIALLLSADPEGFTRVDEVDGVLLEERAVKGSSFVELRATTVSRSSMEALCRATWGDGSKIPQEEGLKGRVVLEQTPTSRITYDTFRTPIFSDRDYVARADFELGADRCEVRVSLANERKRVQAGYVRIPVLNASWVFVPTGDGRTRIVYRIHTEAGGSIPAFMAEGSRKAIARKWVKLVQDRALLPAYATAPSARAEDAGAPGPDGGER